MSDFALEKMEEFQKVVEGNYVNNENYRELFGFTRDLYQSYLKIVTSVQKEANSFHKVDDIASNQ